MKQHKNTVKTIQNIVNTNMYTHYQNTHTLQNKLKQPQCRDNKEYISKLGLMYWTFLFCNVYVQLTVINWMGTCPVLRTLGLRCILLIS
jgi:hypothetical protein